MPPSETGRSSTQTTSNELTEPPHLRSSVHSLASSINTILPQYSASTEEINTPFSIERHIRGETYRFQVLSEQLQSPRSRSRDSRLSFQSDSTVLPPRYSTILTSPQHVALPNEDPLMVQHHEHRFSVQSKKPWATVFMFTPTSIPGMPKAPQTSLDIPSIYGEEPVLGMLELDIDSPKAIEQIAISLQGRMWNGYTDVSTKILDQSYLLWHKSTPVKEGKLLGSHQLPFSFQLKDDQRRLNSREQSPTQETMSPVTPYIGMRSPTASPSSPSKGFGSPISAGYSTGPSRWSPKVPQNTRVPNIQPDSGSSTTGSSHTSAYREVPIADPSTYASSSASTVSPVAPRSMIREKGQSAWSLRPSPMSSPSESLTRPDPLPPSLREKGIPATIEYTLSVRIQRRLRPDNIIKTEVLYVPSTIAEAASPKRQRAHAAGAVSPGPYHDPEGWYALPETVMRGEVNGRPIQINSTLHIGNPRSYCRGTTIPCYLTFSSDDTHTMGLICNPDSPLVRLTRRLRQFEPRKIQSQTSHSLTPFRDENAVEYDDQECVLNKCTILTLAMWRVPSKRDLESLDYRKYYLEGEIHLENDLVPSHFSRQLIIEYNVELLPLISDIFKDSAPDETSKEGTINSKGILASSLVHITTMQAPGQPAPVKFSKPPQYGKIPDVKKEETDWNNRSLQQFGLI